MKRRDLRMIWNTNAPHSNSGYGSEMRDLLYRLKKDGWPVSISAFFGVQGAPIDIDYQPHPGVNLNPKYYGTKIKHYPQMADPYGADAMVNHAQDWQANVILTMQDVWTLNPQFLQQIKYWIPWVPIDKDPVPPNVLANLRYAYKIVTFSRFGQQALQKAGFTSTLILEGIDTEIFKPMDKKEVRKEIGIADDIFLVGMMGANKENPPRKGWQEGIEAFARFSEKHPEARLFIQNQQMAPGNFPIREFMEHLKIADKIIFVGDYKQVYSSNPQDMMKWYNCFDFLLHPSQTEGFGLCIVESQACGTPVVINNIHSMPELIIDTVTGYRSRSSKPRFTNDLSYVIPADVDSLVYNMERLYQDIHTDEAKISKACRDLVVSKFSIETTYKAWTTLFEGLQTEILPLQVPQNTLVSK